MTITREQGAYIAKAILAVVAAGAVLTLAVTMPGLISVMGAFLPNSRRSRASARQSFKRLIKKGYLKSLPNGRLVLTKEGRERLDRYQLDDLTLPESSPSEWDGRWRLILFDVPEEKNYLRGIFRRKLQQLGFHYLQRSAWLYPFACEGAIAELGHRLELDEHLAVIVTDSFSQEPKFLKRFHLTATA